MNATSPVYNPFAAAAKAAIAELGSVRAQQFYSLQAQKDTQNALEATLIVIGWVYQVSEMAYRLGALSRTLCDEMVANSQSEPIVSSMVLAPAAVPLALLPAAPQPPTIRLPGSLGSSGVAIVPPAPAIDAPVQVDAIPGEAAEMNSFTVPDGSEVESQSSVGAETIAPPRPETKPGQRRSTVKTKQPTATGGKSRRKSPAS